MSEAQNFSTGQMAIDAELVTGILQRSLRNGTIVGAAAIGAFAMFSASRFGIEPDSFSRATQQAVDIMPTVAGFSGLAVMGNAIILSMKSLRQGAEEVKRQLAEDKTFLRKMADRICLWASDYEKTKPFVKISDEGIEAITTSEASALKKQGLAVFVADETALAYNNSGRIESIATLEVTKDGEFRPTYLARDRHGNYVRVDRSLINHRDEDFQPVKFS